MHKTDIGGCLPLECGNTPFYHQNALFFNSGRNALRAVLRKLRPNRLFMPAFTCPVVADAVRAEHIVPVFYDLNEDLTPAGDIPDTDVLLFNNRFGLFENSVRKTLTRHPRTLVDAAQAFFAPPAGLATVYSPRKFFGLPDGGAVVSDLLTSKDVPAERDFSYDRAAHLLIAADLGSEKADADFARDDDDLNGFPVMAMSRLTRRMLGNIDYDFVRARRLKNFHTLHATLKTSNRLHLSPGPNDVPMFYPYLSDTPLKIRKKLLSAGIDTPIFWENTEPFCAPNTRSAYLRDHIVPIPCDQRYDTPEMTRILNALSDIAP